MREPLRTSAVMVLGMAVGAFILGYATPFNLTSNAMTAHRDDIFSGRLVSDVAAEYSSEPLASAGDFLSSLR